MDGPAFQLIDEETEARERMRYVQNKAVTQQKIFEMSYSIKKRCFLLHTPVLCATLSPPQMSRNSQTPGLSKLFLGAARVSKLD